MTATAWLAAGLAVLASLGSPEKSGQDFTTRTGMTRMSTWFITYGRPLAPPGEVSLIVTPEQGCLLRVTGPVMGIEFPQRSEIGTYHFPCTHGEAVAVRGLIGPAISEAAATQGETSPRGTRFLTFGLGSTGSDRVDPLGSIPLRQKLPPAVAKFDDAMIALARKAVDFPIATLRASGDPAACLFTPGGELHVRVKLSGTGTAAVQVRNPAAAGSTGLDLILRDEQGEVTFIEVKPGEVTQVEDGKPLGTAAAPVAKLNPGESLVLGIRIRRQLFLRKGSYEVEVRYTSDTADIPETQAVQGLVQTVAGRITVSSRGAH